MNLYFTETPSPIGLITLVSSEKGLCGLYNENQRHWPKNSNTWQRDTSSLFYASLNWLNAYFSGSFPDAPPPVCYTQGTDFQKRVWRALEKIPRGETTTYAALANAIQKPNAVRPVGTAVGRNPLSIIVPCHRVIGSNGLLVGYAGGLDKKKWLLQHESAVYSKA